MRPIAAAQNAHRFPLNSLFRAESHVRILRVFTESKEPLTITEIAGRAELTVPGARRAMAILVQSGMVDGVSGENRRLYSMRRAGPLSTEIRQLFSSEQRRFEDMLEKMRHTIRQLSPPAQLAWTSGIPSRTSDPWKIVVIQTAQGLTQCISDLKRLVTGIEEEFRIPVEIAGFSPADQPKVNFDQVQMLAGGPANLGVSKSVSTPRKLSYHYPRQLSHAQSIALAILIKRDPSLLRRARIHLSQTLAQQVPGSKYLEEWRDLLEHDSPDHLSQILTSPGEQAERLRSSSPFEAVLSSNEREYLLAATDADG